MALPPNKLRRLRLNILGLEGRSMVVGELPDSISPGDVGMVRSFMLILSVCPNALHAPITSSRTLHILFAVMVMKI